jgi:uncharacterized protein
MSDPYGPPPGESPEGEQPPAQQYGQQPNPYGQPPIPPGGPPYGGPPYAQQPGPNRLTPDEMTWGGAAHWSSLVAAFVALAFLGPLLVFLVKGNQSQYVREQSAESLNFQLSMMIYGVVGTIVGVVLTVVTLGVGFLLFLPLAIAFGVYWLVFTIIGSVRAARGELYRYPLTIRMVS